METDATVTPGLHRTGAGTSRPGLRQMLNKVPEVTLYFWIIKILCTTVGETAADYLNDTLGFGLTNTTYLIGSILIVILVFQFRLRRYLPGVYWLAVVFISVVGTLITDNMVENYGVSLVTSTTIFSILLALSFAAWYASEKSLSIHTIVTTRREGFYWLVVLFTFALGTAAGDLTAEKLNVGYWKSAILFGAIIGAVFAAHRLLKLNAILSFWIAYILTRPLGASIGDYFSQAKADGGLGLGTTVTSFIFLAAILATVVYLSVTRRDQIERNRPADHASGALAARVLVVANKTAATPALIDAVRARASAGAASFFLLVPNPDDHLVFDRNSQDVHIGAQVMALAMPLLQEAAGGPVEGRVASSPNAYDDIVEELNSVRYDEIILSTLPTHVSHWLHLDLPRRIADLGYPVKTVTASHAPGGRPHVSGGLTAPAPTR
ncbi:MAG: hypothetical protein QOH12_1377 [Solirubrobacteraceae bacterium]|jgi:uncharacterized membrane-anchored protein|nr:hypothetical protein [Solirubrobacteraceae bacterium]